MFIACQLDYLIPLVLNFNIVVHSFMFFETMLEVGLTIQFSVENNVPILYNQFFNNVNLSHFVFPLKIITFLLFFLNTN